MPDRSISELHACQALGPVGIATPSDAWPSGAGNVGESFSFASGAVEALHGSETALTCGSGDRSWSPIRDATEACTTSIGVVHCPPRGVAWVVDGSPETGGMFPVCALSSTGGSAADCGAFASTSLPSPWTSIT